MVVAGPQILSVKSSSIIGTIFPAILLIVPALAVLVGVVGVWVPSIPTTTAVALIAVGACFGFANAMNFATPSLGVSRCKMMGP